MEVDWGGNKAERTKKNKGREKKNPLAAKARTADEASKGESGQLISRFNYNCCPPSISASCCCCACDSSCN
jgi:hypothetical protein